MFRILLVFLLVCAALVPFAVAHADEQLAPRVGITPSLSEVAIGTGASRVVIKREQDPNNTINPRYARTSRDCPPFCIQPIVLAPGVETIGELEMLEYLRASEAKVLVIDSRTPDWLKHGSIPGAVNIPWTQLSPSAGADPFGIADILERRFGAISQEGLWNFADAKTLVLFCNGPWCGQSPSNIKTLLNFGYPAHKLKWYRGGMQAWESLGLSVTP